MPDPTEPPATEKPAPTSIVFLDTEFTSLIGEPLLLSVGMVAGTPSDREFYAEVTDEARLEAASAFASNVVLPQFGKVRGAACTHLALGARAADFLDGMASLGNPGRLVSVAFESDHDWALLEDAVRRVDAERWLALAMRLQPVNVYNAPGFAAGERAANAYFDAQRVAPFSRHHALCDARALRIACEAAAAATLVQARPDSTTPARASQYRSSSARTSGEIGLGSQSAPGHERV